MFRSKEKGLQKSVILWRRSDRIRTCDLYVPNVALYQAEPHSDKIGNLQLQIPSYGKGTWTPTNRVRVCCAANYTIPHQLLSLLLISCNSINITDSERKSKYFFKFFKKYFCCPTANLFFLFNWQDFSKNLYCYCSLPCQSLRWLARRMHVLSWTASRPSPKAI